uniref:ABCA1-4-like C-terminal R2 regulatory domain-containing protein n=1 Tax=Graphocephala atropunctata TaxID=36148 RepID=A0A1B6LU48_9HEMI
MCVQLDHDGVALAVTLLQVLITADAHHAALYHDGEALCTRLTIMVKGRMMCIGSNQYLKQRYGQGYTIMIKLHTHSSKDVLLQQLKEEVQQSFTFNCTLKDEHTSLLHYHMSDTSMSLSNLFRIMEGLKQMHSIIEDYTVSDTTLEQVFIMFARQSGH